jgi:phosphoglycolate phosphatase-like HAD superfamily hydrolase
LNGYFKGIYGAPEGKVKMLSDIMKNEKVSPKEVLFIGDSKEDYEVARNLGLQFIARISGNGFEGTKLQSSKDLFEIKSIILNKYIEGN